MQVSLLIAINDHPALGKLLEALSNQTIPASRFETIFAVSSHGDLAETEFLVSRDTTSWPAQPLVVGAKGGRAAAHNAALRAAQGEIIVLLADDMVPVPRFLEFHLEFHAKNSSLKEIGIGPAVFPERLRAEPLTRWLEDSGSLFGLDFTPERRTIPEQFFYVANSSVKRKLFDEVGLFDESFQYDAWDDYEFAERLWPIDCRAQLVPEAIAFHEHDLDLDERIVAMQRAGQAAVLFERKYPGYRPWQDYCSEPLWRIELRRNWYALRQHFFLSVPAQERYYKESLQSAFVKAYQDAKKQRLEAL